MNSSGGVRMPSSTTLNPASLNALDSIFVPMTWASIPTVPVIIVGLFIETLLFLLESFNRLEFPYQLSLAEGPEILDNCFVVHSSSFGLLPLGDLLPMELFD